MTRAWRPPTIARGHVGSDEPDEADHADRGHGRRGEHRGGHQRRHARALQPDAEHPGSVVVE
jgi:hypothetical protein